MCTHGLQAAAGLPRAAAGSVSCFCRASKVAPVHAGSQGGFPAGLSTEEKGTRWILESVLAGLILGVAGTKVPAAGRFAKSILSSQGCSLSQGPHEFLLNFLLRSKLS